MMTEMGATRRSPEESRKNALRAETIGILVLVLLGFLLILLRYGRFIDWHAR
jgi:hypothetical protein